MVYGSLRLFFSFYLRLFHLLRIKGMNHVPATGPVILCANHTSYFDSMLLALCTPRQVHFLIYRSFYHHPVLGWFVRKCGAIAVAQNGADKNAMGRALAVLKSGGVVGIFPEGRLSTTGQPNRGKAGAALLAVASGASIVPITIRGAFEVFAKGRKWPSRGIITVDIHGPVHSDRKKRGDKLYLQSMTDRVMARIGRRLAVHGRKRSSFHGI